VHTVESELLGPRQVLVYLPPGYSEHGSYRYPLALLQDGQNVFDADTSVFGVEWGVDETAERLIAEQQIRPLVLAAVYNSPERVIEYTPFPDPEHGGGGAAVYERFLIEELLPFLQERYSLSRVAEDRLVIGSSLGGLLALHTGWTYPDHFASMAALSPSLWWGGRGMITAMASGPPPSPRPRLWLDGGTLESPADANQNGVPDLIDDLRTLRAVLISHGYEVGKDLLYQEVEGQTHDEAAWSLRIGEVLRAFFPKRESWREE
jgi:enterochelin esterase-like enzyme